MPNIAKPRVLRNGTLNTEILGLEINLGKTIMI